jgi:hypothetical protein
MQIMNIIGIIVGVIFSIFCLGSCIGRLCHKIPPPPPQPHQPA